MIFLWGSSIVRTQLKTYVPFNEIHDESHSKKHIEKWRNIRSLGDTRHMKEISTTKQGQTISTLASRYL